ncbi:MAG: hypothetical protein HYY23_13290 [Verrucomicrobia bacterium]|nr:hypothetical protein [Verrucomicrobiota bacterium]
MKDAGKIRPPLAVRAALVLALLKQVRGLDDAEKSVHALGLAATPQERWDLFENLHIRDFLRCRRALAKQRRSKTRS